MHISRTSAYPGLDSSALLATQHTPQPPALHCHRRTPELIRLQNERVLRVEVGLRGEGDLDTLWVALLATDGLRNDGLAHLCNECQSAPVREPGDSIVALFGLENKLEFLSDRQTDRDQSTTQTGLKPPYQHDRGQRSKTTRPSTQTGLKQLGAGPELPRR